MRCQARVSGSQWAPWWATHVPLQAVAAAAERALSRQIPLTHSFRTCLSFRELTSPRSWAPSVMDQGDCVKAGPSQPNVEELWWVISFPEFPVGLAQAGIGPAWQPHISLCPTLLPSPQQGFVPSTLLKNILHVQLCLRAYFKEKPTHESYKG